jgi:hypothetical protein
VKIDRHRTLGDQFPDLRRCGLIVCGPAWRERQQLAIGLAGHVDGQPAREPEIDNAVSIARNLLIR